ncbi:hypothetical protein LUCX_19 [Xanthomonas phage vB_XciM_LucasX]|nr:hypothetical protein LUCX_19 [Xanthomonas phage vB_XciM_LucasX]
MSNDRQHCKTIDMVRQLVTERHYSAEQVAIFLNTNLKRAKALIAEVKRQDNEELA